MEIGSLIWGIPQETCAEALLRSGEQGWAIQTRQVGAGLHKLSSCPGSHLAPHSACRWLCLLGSSIPGSGLLPISQKERTDMARAAVGDLARTPHISMPRSLPAPQKPRSVCDLTMPLLTPADPLSSPQALQERRARCETQNIDPVVWTNQQVLKWVRDIDLKVRGDEGVGGW